MDGNNHKRGGRNFNPRSPRGERPRFHSRLNLPERFQSTLPAGGATYHLVISSISSWLFQSTLPAGGATFWETSSSYRFTFQSTLPAGGATSFALTFASNLKISIHAPRGGSDFAVMLFFQQVDIYFNPRSPRGERQQKCMFFMREFIHIP